MKLWRLSLALLLILCANQSIAFGSRGHIVVARLALRDLHPVTIQNIEVLLSDNARDGLDAASTWADELRDGGEKVGANYHYINMPQGQCRYVKSRDCPSGDCVIERINYFVSILQNQTRPKSERADALRWIVHLVGDLHQPLHVGYYSDRGGNLYQVTLNNVGTNLHAVWDVDLVKRPGLRAGKLAKWIVENEKIPVQKSWSPMQTIEWAKQSCQYLSKGVYPKQRRLNKEYLDRNQAVVMQQLRLAGARLAIVLNQALADPVNH